jgi:hypothetical protein
MSEPIWCAARQHYCRCQDFGRRCEDYTDTRAELDEAAEKFMEAMADSTPPPQSGSDK